jgi:hypothetical protein
MSETSGTAELTKALVKVQQALKHAAKDSLNPHFKTKYADLGSVWDACREALLTNGFAVAQTMAPAAAGWVCVETRLLHVSGQSLVSSCVLPVVKSDPQAYGSAITYGRRYGLGAMVGVIADDDDDANAASAPKAPPPRPAASRTTDAPARQTAQAPRPTTSGGATLPNYGSLKGQPVAGQKVKDLEFYAGGCRKSLGDPAKERWHDKERQLLAAIEAEIAAQTGGLTGGIDEPPPHTDSDAF